MKSQAAMIVAHQMYREIKAGAAPQKSWAQCLKDAWSIVKSGKTIVVINVIRGNGRKAKAWAKNLFTCNDGMFNKIIAPSIKKAGGEALGWTILNEPKKEKAAPYMSTPCPKCGTYCWGDCSF